MLKAIPGQTWHLHPAVPPHAPAFAEWWPCAQHKAACSCRVVSVHALGGHGPGLWVSCPMGVHKASLGQRVFGAKSWLEYLELWYHLPLGGLP